MAKMIGLREIYEVLIQVGDSGNDFRRMNVAYTDMMNFILDAMLTGRLLRISFLKLLDFEATPEHTIEGYTTPFRVVGIQVLDQKMERE
jgi:hypothetical protein